MRLLLHGHHVGGSMLLLHGRRHVHGDLAQHLASSTTVEQAHGCMGSGSILL